MAPSQKKKEKIILEGKSLFRKNRLTIDNPRSEKHYEQNIK